MDEQLNSIVKQLNRLAQKQTGLNPKAKSIERALKTFVDGYSGGGAGGDSIWGNISGSIENQTDLIDKIDSMIDNELANFEHLDYEIVDTLPTTGEAGKRYLVKHATDDRYEEYMYVNGQWYDIGSSGDVNLDNYYNKTETDALLTGKANVNDIPTKTSDLTNDSQFVDKDTDQLTNYTKTTALNNALNLKADKSTTYTKDEVNDKLDLKADTDDIPTKTSDLTNDSGFITKAVNNLENYTKTTDLNTALALKADATDIPAKTSDLTNDTGYIDANVNNLTNYTKTSDLNTALNSKADKLTTYTKTEVDTSLLLKADKSNTYTKTEVDTALGDKQATLVSGTNIKTINNQSLLGSGNINISGGGSYTAGTGIDITGDEISVDTDVIQTKLVSGTDIKTINGTSLLGSGNLGNFYTKTESDTALGLKADKATTYTKTETDTALGLKADKSTTYTKTEVDTALGLKADKSTTYTKTEVDTKLGDYYTETEVDAKLGDYYTETEIDTALNLKADKSTTYTKTEVDTALNLKADKSTTYTKTEVDTALDNKVDKTSVKSAKSTTATDVYNAPYINSTLGDLTDLTTNTKTDLVSAISEINDYVKNNSVDSQGIIVKSGTIPSGSWQELGTNAAKTLNPGRYLFLFCASVNGTNDGLITFAPGFKGTKAVHESLRSTHPLKNGLVTSSQMLSFYTATTEEQLQLNIYAYTTSSVTVVSLATFWFRIN